MNKHRLGFTIVELLVVIVVIGILAGVIIIGYGAWRGDIVEKQLKSDLFSAASAIENDRNFNKDNEDSSSLPAGFQESDGVTVTVKSGGGTYCIQATSEDYPDKVFNLKNRKQPTSGPCDAYYVSTISVGGYTTCGIEYGKAYCWGDSGSSGTMLGNGVSGDSSVPVAVNTSIMSDDVTAIVSGNTTVCALAGGKVYCWGGVDLLGNGSTVNSAVPVAVDTSLMNGTVTDLAMGSSSACAIAGGKVYCWGSNHAGQIGDGTTTARPTPTPVITTLMSGEVTQLTSGSSFTCAISAGKAYCWGHSGSLGDGTWADSSSPVAVLNSVMSGAVTSIESTDSHTCAIASGKAYCWGSGGYSPTANGQLGNGTTAAVNAPTPVVSSVMSGTVTQLSTRGASTCAVADGKAYCWGENSKGELGNGTTTSSSVPVAVNTSVMSKNVTAITTNDSHVCAISDQKLYCWGAGTSGQLGHGASANALAPVAVGSSVMKDEVTSVVLGYVHSCALADGRAYCWGNNAQGQLGVGNTSPVNIPTLIVPNP